jgi:hypothetical protein
MHYGIETLPRRKERRLTMVDHVLLIGTTVKNDHGQPWLTMVMFHHDLLLWCQLPKHGKPSTDMHFTWVRNANAKHFLIIYIIQIVSILIQTQ